MSATRSRRAEPAKAKTPSRFARMGRFVVETWRLGAILLGLCLCVVAVGWKVGMLHVTQRDFLQQQGDSRAIRTLPIAANRGLVFDRNGEPLAVSTPVISISVDPLEIADNAADIRRLANA